MGPGGQAPGMLVTLWDRVGRHWGCQSRRGTRHLLGMLVTPWDQAAAGDVGHPVGPGGQAPGMLVTPWDRAFAGVVGHTVGLSSCGGCWCHQLPSARGCSLVTSLLSDLECTAVPVFPHF